MAFVETLTHGPLLSLPISWDKIAPQQLLLLFLLRILGPHQLLALVVCLLEFLNTYPRELSRPSLHRLSLSLVSRLPLRLILVMAGRTPRIRRD